MADREWMVRARCRGAADPEVFFPYHGSGQHGGREYRRAVREIRDFYCNECPVVNECWQHAEELQITAGVWGGVGRDPKMRAILRGQAG